MNTERSNRTSRMRRRLTTMVAMLAGLAMTTACAAQVEVCASATAGGSGDVIDVAIRIADLQAKRVASRRTMTNCLAVTANCRDIAGIELTGFEQGIDSIGKTNTECRVELSEFIQRDPVMVFNYPQQ